MWFNWSCFDSLDPWKFKVQILFRELFIKWKSKTNWKYICCWLYIYLICITLAKKCIFSFSFSKRIYIVLQTMRKNAIAFILLKMHAHSCLCDKKILLKRNSSATLYFFQVSLNTNWILSLQIDLSRKIWTQNIINVKWSSQTDLKKKWLEIHSHKEKISSI